MARSEAPLLKSPKYKSEAGKKVIIGEINRLPSRTSLNPNLEAALER